MGKDPGAGEDAPADAAVAGGGTAARDPAGLAPVGGGVWNDIEGVPVAED